MAHRDEYPPEPVKEVHTRQFNGWFIPVELIEVFNLKPAEALLWSEIRALSRRDRGCTASNEWLAENLGFNPFWISRLISRLIALKLVEKISFNGRTRTLRAILPTELPSSDPRASKTCPARVAKSKAVLPTRTTLNDPSYYSEGNREYAEARPEASQPARPEASLGELSIPEEPDDTLTLTAPEGTPGARLEAGASGGVAASKAAADQRGQRQRNPLFDALALLDAPQGALTAPGRVAKALALIRSVSPDVTPEEIAVRCDRYRKLWPNATLTSTALANNWGRFASEANPETAKEIARIESDLANRKMDDGFRKYLTQRLATLKGTPCKNTSTTCAAPAAQRPGRIVSLPTPPRPRPVS